MSPKASGPPAGDAASNGSAFAAEPASAPPAVAPTSDQPGTILSIQILRFLAALSVVLFHAHNTLAYRLAGHKEDSIDHAFRVGASGVHIFFVISGFVMVYTTWRSQLTSGMFLSRRLIRIYPIYWVMAAAYLVAHFLLGTAYQLSASQIGAALFLLPAGSPLIIGPGWTLSYEMYFYICFAFALLVGLRRGLFLLSVLYLLSTMAGLVVPAHSAIGNVTTNSLLLEFASGAWLGYAFAHGYAVRPRVGGALVLTGLALFASGFWLHYERLPSVIAWGAPSLLLVSGALAFEPWLRSALGRRIARLGDSSYLLYLSHILVIDLLIATPIGSLGSSLSAAAWLSLPIATFCTMAAAVGYELIELPLLKILKRWFLAAQIRRAPSSFTAS